MRRNLARVLSINAALVVLGALAIHGSALAQQCEPIKLNRELPDGGAVKGFSILPDDTGRIAYIADGEVVDVTDLYTVPQTGSTDPKFFDLDIPQGRETPSFPKFTADGSRAVYRVDAETAEVSELFSISTDDGGGNAVKISGMLVANGEVEPQFAISANEETVVYLADQEVAGQLELFRTGVLGGTTNKINSTLAKNGAVQNDFKISSDGAFVVYRAEQDAEGVVELYSAPIGGGMPVKLNAPLDDADSVEEFAITPDGDRVVYTSGQNVEGTTELLSVPISGGQADELSGAEADDSRLRNITISPDGTSIVFNAFRSVSTFTVRDVYGVPLSGAVSPVRLNNELIGVDSIDSFRISPDSQWVVFEGEQDGTEGRNLFSVPIAGGDVTQLSAQTEDTSGVGSYRFTPNSATVVFEADDETPFTTELFSVPIGGGMARKLNGTLVENADLDSFSITPSGRWVVYMADQDTFGTDELYSVSINGGRNHKLNGPLVDGGEVGRFFATDFMISPDEKLVTYLADQDTLDATELYTTQLNCGLIFEDGFGG